MDKTRPSTLIVILATFISAVLLILSFPRPGLFWLAWLALVPWLIVLPQLSLRQALLSSFTFGLVFFAGLCSWVAIFGYLPWLLLAMAEALFIITAGIGIWLCRGLQLHWRILAATCVWTCCEWLRGQSAFGFTWGWLAYSQSSWLGMIQLASLTGPAGITFLIVLHNAVLAEALRDRTKTSLVHFNWLISVWGAIILVVAFGYWQITRPTLKGRELTVVVIQPAVREPSRADVNRNWTPEDVSEDRNVFMDLVAQAAPEHPNIVIAPESALPGVLNKDAYLFGGAVDAARQARAWLLVGSHYEIAPEVYHNSAYLFSPMGENTGRYDKVQRVPFGEFVPGRNWLPGVHNYAIREQDLAAGRVFHPLQADATRLGTVICFESTFPRPARSLVNQNAGLLAVITNDGWFLRSAAAQQHEQMAVLRAVENHRWVARAALTGISCFISPQGIITKEQGLFKRGFLVQKIKVGEGRTFYTRHGDWFVVVSAVLLLICLAMSLRLKIEQNKTNPPAI
jgi:apolipoprotein N-acyltransferase